MTRSTSVSMTPEGNIYSLKEEAKSKKEGRKKDSELSVTTSSVTMTLFETFWKNYPRKIGKGHARLAFARSLKVADAQTIIAGCHVFADHVRSEGTEPRFIPHPTTWLNGERWEDEVESGAASTWGDAAGEL